MSNFKTVILEDEDSRFIKASDIQTEGGIVFYQSHNAAKTISVLVKHNNDKFFFKSLNSSLQNSIGYESDRHYKSISAAIKAGMRVMVARTQEDLAKFILQI